jgi:hypothetical protein
MVRGAYKQLLTTPCSVFLIDHPSGPVRPSDKEAEAISSNLLIDYPDCAFRGVSFERLRTILERGIDVNPTDSVIFADSPCKAFEYGEWPKVLLALRRECLKQTFKEVSADASREELEKVRRDYPTILRSRDGSKFWCTRLNEDDHRIATDYEFGYARWIPGDPWDALKAVFVVCRPEDHDELRKFIHKQAE